MAATFKVMALIDITETPCQSFGQLPTIQRDSAGPPPSGVASPSWHYTGNIVNGEMEWVSP